MSGAGDEITRLALDTNAFSAKDGTCMTLKANVFGARHELTRLVIECQVYLSVPNAFGNAFVVVDEP